MGWRFRLYRASRCHLRPYDQQEWKPLTALVAILSVEGLFLFRQQERALHTCCVQHSRQRWRAARSKRASTWISGKAITNGGGKQRLRRAGSCEPSTAKLGTCWLKARMLGSCDSC